MEEVEGDERGAAFLLKIGVMSAMFGDRELKLLWVCIVGVRAVKCPECIDILGSVLCIADIFEESFCKDSE